MTRRRNVQLALAEVVLTTALGKPKSKKRVAHERQRWFRRGRAWRVGGEARISRLKHRFGMARSRYRGQRGTERTALWAGIANNLVAIGAKAAGGRA